VVALQTITSSAREDGINYEYKNGFPEGTLDIKTNNLTNDINYKSSAFKITFCISHI
jgi:hypothetical protein